MHFQRRKQHFGHLAMLTTRWNLTLANSGRPRTFKTVRYLGGRLNKAGGPFRIDPADSAEPGAPWACHSCRTRNKYTFSWKGMRISSGSRLCPSVPGANGEELAKCRIATQMAPCIWSSMTDGRLKPACWYTSVPLRTSFTTRHGLT